MQVDFLKLLSEVMIGNYFNRPKEALAGIEHLLTNHQAEIGSGNALNLALLTCQIEGNMGNYVVAADRAKNIMEQVKVQGGSPEAYSALQQFIVFMINCVKHQLLKWINLQQIFRFLLQ